ncbi:MAG: hypothetical protein ACYS0D_12100 [Planctomycetota bacterium]|jgi:MYXO-CTERM domain-containing protein
MRVTLAMVGGLAVCAIGPGPRALGGIIDQTQEVISASFNMDASTLEWQQSIEVGAAGLLTQVDIYVTTPGSSTFYVNAGSPWQVDAHDFVLNFSTAATGWHSIDVSSAGLVFSVGEFFVFGWDNTNGGLWTGGAFIDGGDPYPPGELWLNTAPYVPGWELAFRTYMSTSPAPGGLALLSLAFLTRTRRRR